MSSATNRFDSNASKHARLALSAIFFANGAGFATWATRIPDIQRHIGIGDGALGVALFCIAAGSLASMPVVCALASSGSLQVTALRFIDRSSSSLDQFS
jgi:hypothetical protein